MEHALKTGAPVLEDALVAFDCKVINDTVCQGTHRVFFCEVREIKLSDGETIGRLICFDRQYHGLQKSHFLGRSVEQVNARRV